MKLMKRRNGTTTIDGLADGDLRLLAMAAECLENHHWQVARGLAEGSRGERDERDRAAQAKNLRYLLLEVASASSARTFEVMTSSSSPIYNYLVDNAAS